MATICGVGAHSHADRGDDCNWTPTVATEALILAEAKWLPDGKLWEPACGNGAIVDVLRKRGFEVVASDIRNHGCKRSRVQDFLTTKPTECAGIITNPPFKLAREFVEHALKTTPYVAMLLRLAFLESVSRKPWFESSTLARVHVSSRRLPMMHRLGWKGPKAGSAVCHAWFVWDQRHEGRPEVRWFDYKAAVLGQRTAANDNDPRQIDLEEAIAGSR